MKKWHLNLEKADPKVSLVIASYNNPRALGLCLEGYRRQSFFETPGQSCQFILADDGSSDPEVEAVFRRFAEETGQPCTFLQQDHKGWGKPRMLNWSVLEARADNLIFTDGDCIPHRHFIHWHASNAKPGSVQVGRRVDLMEKLGPAITLEDVRRGSFNSALWLLSKVLKGEVDYGGHGFYLGCLGSFAACFSSSPHPTLLGSNFSMHKKDLIGLNGFDESFATPGIGEDTDLERRILLAGLKLEWITYRAVQFHLWHNLTTVGAETHKIFEDLKKKGTKEAVTGLKQLPEDFRKSSSF